MIGSPATVESENFTVRRITVWKTVSPQACDQPVHHLAAVQRAAVEHGAEHAVDLEVRG